MGGALRGPRCCYGGILSKIIVRIPTYKYRNPTFYYKENLDPLGIRALGFGVGDLGFRLQCVVLWREDHCHCVQHAGIRFKV